MEIYSTYDLIKILIKEREINSVLFLENQSFERGSFPKRCEKKLKDVVNCIMIDQASLKLNKVKNALSKTQMIIAETSFIYEDEIYKLVKLLMNIEPIDVIIYYRGGNYLNDFLDSLPVYELEKINKHNIYIIENSTYLKENLLPKLNLDKIINKKRPVKSPLSSYSKHPLGNVFVNRITGFGNEFDAINLGDNIQILNDKHTTGFFGAWVIGKTEPVLLINFDDRHEWKYEKYDSIDKVVQFICSMSPLKKNDNTISLVNAFREWLNNSKRSNKNEIYETLDHIKYNFLPIMEIQRRGNWNKIESAVTEYFSKFTYFRENLNNNYF